MAERVMTFYADGRVRVIRVSDNGDELDELATMKIGPAPEDMAIRVAVALSDLQAQISGGTNGRTKPSAPTSAGPRPKPLPAGKRSGGRVLMGRESYRQIHGVRVSRAGVMLLNVLREHPEGLTNFQLWDLTGLDPAKYAQQLGALRRYGLAKKVGNTRASRWYLGFFEVEADSTAAPQQPELDAAGTDGGHQPLAG